MWGKVVPNTKFLSQLKVDFQFVKKPIMAQLWCCQVQRCFSVTISRGLTNTFRDLNLPKNESYFLTYLSNTHFKP